MFQVHFITSRLLKWMKLRFFSYIPYLFIAFLNCQLIFLAHSNIHRWIQIKDFLTSLSHKKESKGSEMFPDSFQVTKLVSSRNTNWILITSYFCFFMLCITFPSTIISWNQPTSLLHLPKCWARYVYLLISKVQPPFGSYAKISFPFRDIWLLFKSFAEHS